MQTFTIKVTGESLTAKDIREAIWQATELGMEEIIVEEN
jgi:hypothetical protein